MLVMTLMTAAEPSGPMWKMRLPIVSQALACGVIEQASVTADQNGDLAARGQMHATGDRRFQVP